MKSEMKRIAIIGAGKIVEDNHLPVLCAMNDVEVAWCCDLNASRRDLMREMYQVSTCSPQEVTAQQVAEIDLMLVAIPLGYRASYLDLSRTQSKPLILEKPISVDEEALKLLKDNFHAQQLGVVLQRRYYQSSRVMREIISDQRYGKLTTFEVVACSYDLKSGGAGRYLTDAKISGGGIWLNLEFMASISRFTRLMPQSLKS